MRSAEVIFEEELSGEPLTQESVVEALKIAQKEALAQCFVKMQLVCCDAYSELLDSMIQ